VAVGTSAASRLRSALDLVLHRGQRVEVERLEHRQPVVAHAGLWQRGELAREVQRGPERLSFGNHPVHQTHAPGLLRVHRPPGEDQIHRTPEADDLWQAHRSQVDQRHPEAATEHSEDRLLGGDAQVAPESELQPSGHRVPLDRRDDRLPEPHPRRAHRTIALRADGAELPLGEGLEVGAAAEVLARTGEDRDRERRVAVELPEGGGERRGGGGIDRVPALGSVEGDDEDAVPLLGPDGHASGVSPRPPGFTRPSSLPGQA